MLTRSQRHNAGKYVLIRSSYLIFLIFWGNQKVTLPWVSSLTGVSKPRKSTNPISKDRYGWVITFKQYFWIFRKDLWEQELAYPSAKASYPFGWQYKFLKFSDENLSLLRWIFSSLKYAFLSTSFPVTQKYCGWLMVQKELLQLRRFRRGRMEQTHNQNNA